MDRKIEILIIVTITDEDGPETQSFHGLGDISVMQAMKDADAALNAQFELDRANPQIPTAEVQEQSTAEAPRPRYAE